MRSVAMSGATGERLVRHETSGAGTTSSRCGETHPANGVSLPCASSSAPGAVPATRTRSTSFAVGIGTGVDSPLEPARSAPGSGASGGCGVSGAGVEAIVNEDDVGLQHVHDPAVAPTGSGSAS